eukprot:CAMPEP_0119556602 /NCGR_PEP_ID=MMETSP1352-20130426/8492_1 /TAXON_ID=265584 /ORGANISM="Stauroneis constricta, Strain CCMP1120" /LENGTH=339 /DNA_ID=CAMNT_0007603577 /DNA_START=29 /DNA_END=1050 /DNA_ORIENTATION=-
MPLPSQQHRPAQAAPVPPPQGIHPTREPPITAIAREHTTGHQKKEELYVGVEDILPAALDGAKRTSEFAAAAAATAAAATQPNTHSPTNTLKNTIKLDKDVVIPVAIGVLVAAALAIDHHLVDIIKMEATNVWHSYNHVLESSPIATKAVTSGTVYTIGDIISQKTESSGDVDDDGQITEPFELDVVRTLRSTVAGLCGHGILSHFWYEASESFFINQMHWTQWWSVFPKVAIDQLTWGPFWNGVYIMMLGLMKLENPKNIFEDIRRSTVPLLVSGLKLWPLAHVITYSLPTEHRLLWVDAVEIIWVTILATQANSNEAPEATATAEPEMKNLATATER